MEAWVDPRAEWEHMYHQVWRDERDFFYDPGLHGLNREAIKKKYEPYLANVASRDDLNYLFEEMLGEMTVGHMFVGGGDKPEVAWPHLKRLPARFPRAAGVVPEEARPSESPLPSPQVRIYPEACEAMRSSGYVNVVGTQRRADA